MHCAGKRNDTRWYIAISQKVDQDELFLIAADAGAEDVQFGDDVTEIYVDLDYFQGVQQALRDAGIKLDEANMIYDPDNPIELDKAGTMQVMRLIEALEDLDDVQNVYSALDISDEAIAEMETA